MFDRRPEPAFPARWTNFGAPFNGVVDSNNAHGRTLERKATSNAKSGPCGSEIPRRSLTDQLPFQDPMIALFN